MSESGGRHRIRIISSFSSFFLRYLGRAPRSRSLLHHHASESRFTPTVSSMLRRLGSAYRLYPRPAWPGGCIADQELPKAALIGGSPQATPTSGYRRPASRSAHVIHHPVEVTFGGLRYSSGEMSQGLYRLPNCSATYALTKNWGLVVKAMISTSSSGKKSTVAPTSKPLMP